MKTLEEKKLLVKMARAFGQPVDQKLLESIEKEERLNAVFFGNKEEQTNPILKPVSVIFKETPPVEIEPVIEAVAASPEPLPPQPEKPAETGVRPPEEARVKQVADYIKAVSKVPTTEPSTTSELEEVKKTLADLLKKVNTMSWGGGGTGIVRLGQADDFDQSSYGEGYTMRWINGMFRLDPHGGGGGNWILKTANYTATDNDKIIGDTSAGSFTITLPAYPVTGDEVTIMDGSDWSVNPIIIARNGNTIEGIADDMTSNNKGIIITLVYNGNVGIETWQVAATLGPRGPAGYGEVATAIVTTSTYTIGVDDWYVGVNYAGTVTVNLPATANTGRIISIKDESGNASIYPINVTGTVDNDTGGFSIQTDNAGIQLLYRNGWRVI